MQAETVHLDLVVLGNLAVDDVVYEDGETRMRQPGGAALYVALAARLWAVSVGVVSRVGRDYPRETLEALEERGVALDGLRPLAGDGLRTWLLYEGALRRVVHRLDGPSHAEASPTAADIPSQWHATAIHLAPMPFDVQLDAASSLDRVAQGRPRLSLDPFELLSPDHLDSWRKLLSHLEVFFFSEDEVASKTARQDPRSLLEQLAGPRPDTLIYKRGARGGLAYSSSRGRYHEWHGRVTEVRGRTGAGDAFAGGVLAGLLRGETLPRALERGVVAASFTLEGQGAEGLLAASPGSADKRLGEWFGG